MEYKTKDGWVAYLGDNGTLDTSIIVISPKGKKTTETFSHEYAAGFRGRNGAMTRKGFKELAEEAIDAAHEDSLMDDSDAGMVR